MDNKIDQVQKAVDEVAEKVEDRSLAMEILNELKVSMKGWRTAFYAILILLALTIAAFLLYMNQYDYSTTIEATGLYALVDSNGNIIAQDVTQEELSAFKEWWEVNGQNQSNKK